MNVLVLGASGYLGTKLVSKLLDEGYQVTGTKRKHSDLSKACTEKVKWIPASADAIETAIKYTDFDSVINMSCNYGKGNGLDGSVLEANIEFPLRILNKAVEAGIKKFITIGTGLPDDLNMYSFSKKMFSEFGKFYAKKCDIAFCNARLEMFYGADEPKDRFLPDIIQRMIRGEEVNLTIGTQRRDIVAVKDIIYAVLLILESPIDGYREIPVGTGIAPTISDIAGFIWNETGKRSRLNFGAVPMRTDEPDCVADTTELEKLGTWNPVNWKIGLREMIKTVKAEMCYEPNRQGRPV